MPSTIQLGSKGGDVATLQKALAGHGFPCSADGIFGAGTHAQVVAFQKKYGLTPDGVVGVKTWSILLAKDPAIAKPTGLYHPAIQDVLGQAKSQGFVTWEEPWRLWLFGIRAPNRNANTFDDLLGATWTDDKGVRQSRFWPGTTDPGTYWLLNPSNSAGCAILVEGQYLDVWKIDKHAGKYEALCQRNGNVRVYRDPSRDNKHDLDPKTIVTGSYGINIHAATQRPGGVSTAVDQWSAGCQVHATEAGFNEMMGLAREQVSRSKKVLFSYTLIRQWW